METRSGRFPISRPTVTSALENLEGLGIVREMTGKDRYRVYAYGDYFDILEEGTQPI
jgi:Fe2+ or Zn2+ uptake regulation protein